MSGERLLVVEEEARDRTWLAGALRDHGFEVSEAEGGRAGLAELREHPADLVLCGLHTVDDAGHSVLETLSRETPDLPVIIVTGESGMADVVQALRFGAADYLTKPVASPGIVVHAVDTALERHRLRRENSRVKEELETANHQLREYVEELQNDQRAGRQVQLGMLPPSPMAIEGFRLQHHIIPSLFLSGDFVDYFRITDRHFVFYIADVSGHGASSAFVTVLLKNFSRRLRREYRPRMLTEPGEILRWLNQELLESRLDRHVTMFIGVIDCATDMLAYANAGHFPVPALVSGEGARFLELPGKPLGLFPDLRLESAQLQLPESFTLALFSDGVLEVMEEKDLAAKERSILESVAGARSDMSALCARLGLAPELEAPDDIACLLVSRSA
ncbi:MAG TPA: SpoIIE family protein phosphatase [Pseudomonadales bacterium]|nr:SpoIIE family protein phosphatase [Pseudomonadales bacterium]